MILTDNNAEAGLIDNIEIVIMPNIKPNIDFGFNVVEMANNNYIVIDNGESTDGYSSTVNVKGHRSDISNLISFIGRVRENGFSATLSDFNENEHIFGENIDYSSPINVAITKIKEVSFTYQQSAKLSITFEVDDTSTIVFKGAGSFPKLELLQPDFIADTTWNFNVNKTYTKKHYVSDGVYDTGYFEGNFLLNHSELRELREFHRQTRGGVFQLNNSNFSYFSVLGKVTIPVTSPFGIRNITLPANVRIVKIKEKYYDVNNYIVNIRFVQENTLEA